MRPSRPKRLVLIGALAGLLAVPTFASAGGGVQPVTFKDNAFVPATYEEVTAPESIFHWTRQGGSNGSHNIRQDVKLFRSGNPSTNFDEYTMRPSAGTFHYYCEKHGSPTSGMQGKLRVTVVGGTVYQDDTFRMIWASPDTESGDAFDVKFRQPGDPWQVWKNDTQTFSGRFGRNDKPVHVPPSETWDFKARSEKASNPSKHSDWSPPYEIVFI